MMNINKTRYKIVTASDKIHWITLQPLLQDLKEQMDDPELKNNSDALYALEVVHSFVNSLITEGNYQQYKENN